MNKVRDLRTGRLTTVRSNYLRGRNPTRNNAAHVGALSVRRNPPAKRRFDAKVQSALNNIAEKKYKPNSVAATAIDFTGALGDVTASIAQGDTDLTRDGDQLWTRSFEFNYNLIGADSTNCIRVLIWIWKPTSTPVITDIIAYGNGTVAAPLSPYNHDRRGDFFMLYDALHSLDLNGKSSVSKKVIIFKIPRALRKAQFVNQTTVGSNHVYFGVISDSGAATHPTITYNYKLNFTDC